MLNFKCKMCGGNITAEIGATLGTCEHCGETSTLPRANDDKVANLFNRADHYRRLNEFDRAAAAYESILNEDANSAEAHWRLALCRYGIEYVEDPATRRRLPTCHRAQFASILQDADYLAALDNAPDRISKQQYIEEAAAIDAIQKRILAIANAEDPYDVFVCYKESDGGQRTVDSTLAQDIYFGLTNEGLKVFFARITLEGRLGQEYEPYIFSALNSAKVMLVVGTKKEYLEAVWVKNEWSRFLTLAKDDRSRLLIPCYRDMDPYDMPDAFAGLQAQDMAKIGFLQDLVRGVKKVLARDEGKPAAAQPAAAAAPAAAPGVDSLMKRGWLSLEDGDWKQAAGFFDRVLDIDADYAAAYLGLICVDLQVREEGGLAELESPDGITGHKHYKRAVVGDDVRVRLDGYVGAINDRIQKRIQEEREAAELRIRQKYGDLLLDRLSDESKAQATERQKKAQQQLDAKNAKAKAANDAECKRLQAEYDAQYKKWQNQVKTIEAKSQTWKAQRLCPHCGAKLGFFGSCKNCKRKADEALFLPAQPPKLQMPTFTPHKLQAGAALPADVKYEIRGELVFVKLGGIKWRVLVVENEKALLISENILEQRPYHTERVGTTWEHCTLRKYLNTEFYNKLGAAKAAICEVRNENANNPEHGTSGGTATMDRVFLLSIGEAEKYFGNDAERIAKHNGVASWWWLRSPGIAPHDAAGVDSDGYVYVNGLWVDLAVGGVRPALWLNL